jgi:hypothetical protein
MFMIGKKTITCWVSELLKSETDIFVCMAATKCESGVNLAKHRFPLRYRFSSGLTHNELRMKYIEH